MTGPGNRPPRRRGLRLLASSVLLAAGCTSGPVESPPEESDPVAGHTTVDDLCGVLDFADYEATVGVAPQIRDETTEDLGDRVRMYCWLGPSEDDGGPRDHGLDMRAQLYDDEATAETDYRDALGLTDVPLSDMTPVEGPWDEAATAYMADLEQYLLIVRDGDLTIGVIQAVRPRDAIDAEAARDLMVSYATQILAALRV
ncbi:hypothetical protein LX16_4442 [Stackebrandtia albiflava]|uniref:DUF3558 domain-containing protein n=1 Tax=Stackebrandtia albiflava TaxID=406432 RepID=A0A562URH9_9ACTN|nr:hypothetical protein [Stackebrandtia albiflava]TWJ08219.1 hypothetical protein LX16_4442 [Stackebrandtia albiflava]